MDVFQILIFLGIICLGLYQTRKQTQKKTAQKKVVRKTVLADASPKAEEAVKKCG